MRIKSNLGLFGLAIAIILTVSTQNSCTEEMLQELEKQQQQDNKSDKDSIVQPPLQDSILTIAAFLEADTADFTDFTSILKRSDMWDAVSQDSGYTCFVLTNSAVQSCLDDMRSFAALNELPLYASVETLPDSICSIIAKRHLVKDIIRLDSLKEDNGEFNRNNLLDEPLQPYTIEYDFFQLDEQMFMRLPRYYIGYSRVILLDMPATNGIIQVIDRPFPNLTDPLSSQYIPGLLKHNNDIAPDYLKADIFFQAIAATHLIDTLEKYLDFDYYVDYDKTIESYITTGRPTIYYQTSFERFNTVYVEKRAFKYTLFAVTDSILSNVYGINSLDDLERYAQRIYPEGMEYDCDSPESSLFKFMAYHILPEWMPYNEFNVHQPEILRYRTMNEQADVEDFFETMLPHAIMRISTPLSQSLERPGTYINRKGTVSANNLTNSGVRIWNPSENPQISCNAINGGYYFVDRLLLFDNETQHALITRIRVMASTLSPDFINSGARGRLADPSDPSSLDNLAYSFVPGFCKNVEWSDNTTLLVVPRNKTYGSLYGDDIIIMGDEVTFRLPPIPVSASYEIRVSNFANLLQQTVQFYLGRGDGDFTECGTPIDLSIISDDPSIGFRSDKDIMNENQGASQDTIQTLINENDQLMRSNGYMKSSDIYLSNGSINQRDEVSSYRIIVYRGYLQSGVDYYLRMKATDSDFCWHFNFIELVPKDIYQGVEPEDRH